MSQPPTGLAHRARRIVDKLLPGRRRTPVRRRGTDQAWVADEPYAVAARDLGWTASSTNRALLRALDECLQGRPQAVVGVLVRASGSAVPDLLAAARPDLQLTSLDIRGGASDLHVRLAAAGPFDLLVDDTRRGPGRATLFKRAFLHLREGGCYLVRGRLSGARALREQGREPVGDLVERLVALRDEQSDDPSVKSDRRRFEQDPYELGAAIVDLGVRGRHLVVTKAGQSYAKLDEREANQVLVLRQGRSGRVQQTVPGMILESACVLRESPSFRAGQLPTTFEVPDLSMREYLDVTCAPGQVVTQGHLLLPDTYRHVERRRLAQRSTRELGPRFAVPRANLVDAPRVEGSRYFLDSEFRGHFGHALTEQVSRFWGWRAAKQADPDLRALVAVNSDRKQLAGFEKELFAAGGIDPVDIDLVPGPVRVDRLVAVTPMLGNPKYVHPGIVAVWREVSRALAAQAPERDYPRRIFCSRRELNIPGAFYGARRPCRNAEELEALFVDHGFEIVHPEEHPMPEQARIFREAEVIAGYSGSALFNLIFSETPKHLVLVSSESYTAKNEYVISSVLGHRVDLAWCRAEVSHPTGRWDGRAFNSPFTFDFDREGVFVRDVLAGL